jgi:hypothetical protein
MEVGGQRNAPEVLHPGKTRYPLYRRPGGLQGRSGRVRKISPPTGIRYPDRPACSQSLYRLSYPSPLLVHTYIGYLVSLTYKNEHHYTCTDQQAANSSQVHRSLHNFGSSFYRFYSRHLFLASVISKFSKTLKNLSTHAVRCVTRNI